jgi:hypothetical protein
MFGTHETFHCDRESSRRLIGAQHRADGLCLCSGSGLCSGSVIHHWYGGADRDRTGDLLLAKQALSQLSYSPHFQLVIL